MTAKWKKILLRECFVLILLGTLGGVYQAVSVLRVSTRWTIHDNYYEILNNGLLYIAIGYPIYLILLFFVTALGSLGKKGG